MASVNGNASPFRPKCKYEIDILIFHVYEINILIFHNKIKRCKKIENEFGKHFNAS